MLAVFLGAEVQELIKIFSSFISDKISDFKTDLYYQNPDYLEWSYREENCWINEKALSLLRLREIPKEEDFKLPVIHPYLVYPAQIVPDKYHFLHSHKPPILGNS